MRDAALVLAPLLLSAALTVLVMVLGLSALYVRFGGLPWMRGAFYGIGAAVIAITYAIRRRRR